MERTPVLLAAVLLWPAAAWAGKKAPVPSGPLEGSALIEELKSTGADKKRFESYVKRRIARINDGHKARMDYMAKEADIWTSFWTKVRDERRLFEIRLGRQTLDLFESLNSLDADAHDTAITDFETMQANVIRSFEAQQKQKLDEFFAARDARWRDFVEQQQRERSEFLSQAPQDWQKTRIGSSDGAAASSKRKKKAASDEEASSEDSGDEAAPAEAQAEPAPNKKGKGPAGPSAAADDRWR